MMGLVIVAAFMGMAFGASCALAWATTHPKVLEASLKVWLPVSDRLPLN